MRLAFDVSHLNHEKLSGVGIYTVELMKALRQVPGIDLIPVFRPSRWRHRNFFKGHAGETRPWLWGGLGLQADVVHGPDFRVARSSRAARVSSIMDLAFLKPGMTSPEFAAKKKKDLDRLLDHETPDALIAISHDTARALHSYRPQVRDRVHTVWLGGDHFQSLAPSSNWRVEKPYFLFVGNLEARKNILGLLAAFEKFAVWTPDIELVLIGKPGYDGERILAAIEKSPARARIRVIGYAPLPDLHAAYGHALALTYPSWIEGFGIPVIEAMQLNCLVITSSTTATAEITGNTGWTVSPADVDGLARAMLEVARLSEEGRRLALEKARLRSQIFTWRKCAEETVAVYEAARERRKGSAFISTANSPRAD